MAQARSQKPSSRRSPRDRKAIKATSDKVGDLDRAYRLAGMLLRGETLDRKRIAGILQVEESTADRHLRVMRKHIPELEEGRRGRLSTLRAPRDAKGTLPLSRSTGIAACFGSSLATLFRGTPYEQGLRDALSKVVERVRRQDGFEDADRKFWFVAGGGEHAFIDDQGTLDDIVQAVLESKFLKVNYTNFEGCRRQRTLKPLSIALHLSHLYLLGIDTDERATIIRISRIQEVDIRRTGFRYPSKEEYDPDVLLRDSLGIFLPGESHPVDEIEFRLSSKWRAYVKSNKWHHSQSHADEGDAVRVKMTVRLCPELESLLLSFGEDAEVISPDSLREKMALRLKKAAEGYPR